eukprot:CAMPEP_0171184804 /NCGR_PEP_ID=MMETSP0790-20130122/15972_1 /TAXON_ID=2925 /ORGANISM="Alexandrium catenella, Strain OF101" /LENGTH=495 /DNA_ID=CAMNT_0011649801 /DNA_START=106 /DNA_END=1593 /DNA_ORIENTATION=+
MPTASRKAIWTLYFIVFVDLVQITFIFPLLPKIVESLSPGVTGGFLGTPAEKIGLLAGVAAGFEGLAAPYLGRLADRIGRRPVFLVSQFGSIASGVLVGCSTSYSMLIFGRIVNGICGGTAGLAAAYVADVTTREERPGYMTYYMAAIFLGLSIGPVVGGYLSVLGGWRMACFAACGVSFFNLICTALFLQDSGGQRSTSEGGAQHHAADGVLAQKTTQAVLQEIIALQCVVDLLVKFLASVGWTAFEALGVLYIQDCFYSGVPDAKNKATTFYSQLISGAGVVGLVVNLCLYAHVEKCTGLKGSIALGGVLKAIGFWGIATPSLGRAFMFTATQVVVLGDQLQETSINTLITCAVRPTQFGEAMGQMTLFGNLARTIGPFAFGPIYERGGKTIPWYVNIGAALAAIVLCLFARPRLEEAEEEAGPESPCSVEDDGTSCLVRHLSEQTSHAMLLGGQANLARKLDQIPAVLRARSMPVRGFAQEVLPPQRSLSAT